MCCHGGAYSPVWWRTRLAAATHKESWREQAIRRMASRYLNERIFEASFDVSVAMGLAGP
jgi:hypothetical protein